MLSEKEIRHKWEHKVKCYFKTGNEKFKHEAYALEEVLELTTKEIDEVYNKYLDQE